MAEQMTILKLTYAEACAVRSACEAESAHLRAFRPPTGYASARRAAALAAYRADRLDDVLDRNYF